MPETEEGQNKNIGNHFLNSFNDTERIEILKILGNNKYIPLLNYPSSGLSETAISEKETVGYSFIYFINWVRASMKKFVGFDPRVWISSM